MHATYIERFTELANVVGLDFNWSKAWLLLPAGAPRPDADAGLPGGLQITWNGIVVAGAPVGTVAFKQQHATAFFDGLSYRINALVKLGTSDEEEQIAFRLLGLCLALSPTYYLRVVPPSITAGPAAIFDQRMATARMDILGGLSDADRALPRVQRAHDLACLPRRHGGLGHTRAQDLAPFAYLGGLALASKLQQFASKVVYLRPVITHAHGMVVAALGGADAVAALREAHPPFAAVFPEDPRDLSTNHLLPLPALDSESNKLSSGRGVQRSLFLRLVDRRFQEFKDATRPEDAVDAPGSALTTADAYIATKTACPPVSTRQRCNRFLLPEAAWLADGDHQARRLRRYSSRLLFLAPTAQDRSCLTRLGQLRRRGGRLPEPRLRDRSRC